MTYNYYNETSTKIFYVVNIFISFYTKQKFLNTIIYT